MGCYQETGPGEVLSVNSPDGLVPLRKTGEMQVKIVR